MTLTYWAGAVSRIAANVAGDFRRKGSERFAFTQEFLRAGYRFDARPKIPERHFLDLYPEAEALSLPIGELRYTRSNANPLEAFCLGCIAALRHAKRIFEFGTFDGGTTLQLAAACPDAEILTLDLDPGSVNAAQPATIDSEVENVRGGGVGRRFSGRPEAEHIRQLIGDSTNFDYTPWRGAIDLAFIDACHDYAFVKSDTANALRMVPRGVIVWHDYQAGWPGVVKAVDELLPDHHVAHIAGTTLAVLDRSSA